jgi:hypothetical protein
MIEIIIASLAGAIGYFIIGWIVFEFILGTFMSNHMTKAVGFLKNEQDSSLLWIFVSCLAYSLMLTILLSRWIGETTVGDGFVVGATIGGLISIMTSTYWWATSNLFSNFKPIIADVIAAIVTVGCMGMIISFTLNLL